MKDDGYTFIASTTTVVTARASPIPIDVERRALQKESPLGSPLQRDFGPVFQGVNVSYLTHQLQNSLCIYDADVLEKLCQQHIIGL